MNFRVLSSRMMFYYELKISNECGRCFLSECFFPGLFSIAELRGVVFELSGKSGKVLNDFRRFLENVHHLNVPFKHFDGKMNSKREFPPTGEARSSNLRHQPYV